MNFSDFISRLACVGLMLVSFSVSQAQPAQNADKIIAIVGKNRIILQSDLDQMVAQSMQNTPNEIVTDSMRCLILQDMISGKMLVEQAERDSLLVSDDEVEGQLDNRIRYFIRMYGSQEKLEAASGKTIFQMKEAYRDVVKEQMMAEKVRSKILENVRVTPAEVQTFYNSIPKDSLPFYPATVEVGQVVLAPPVNAELDKYARDKAEDIRRQIVKDGKSFEVMAGLYSEDPGSRDNGGRIDGVTRSGYDPAFVQATFRLQNGEISPVIKSRFGYHIIQMIQRRGEEADVRHILIIPQHTDADYKASLLRLDSIRAEIIAGKLSFGEAVSKYSTDEQGKMTGGMIADPRTGSTQLQVDQLDPQLALMIDSLKPGSISQPQIFTAQGERSTRIVILKSRTEPHKANMRDDYAKIQNVAKAQKEQQKLESWILERLPTYYLHVDPKYSDCSGIQHWLAETARN
ncbi:MAG: peptidylprolyl isomerase [Bacteroidetes bacterium]|nr:peptidylprolyl isomerase [Bacteroidota bacterium]